MDVSSGSDRTDIGWIEWFCDLDGHEFLIEIDEDYIVDNFNLYGLKPMIKHYDQALEMILSKEAPDSEDFNNAEYLTVYESAMDLYGLIHARYITSPKGLAIMREKYLMGTFGNCPRVKCKRQYALPIGTSHKLNESRVKVFCPRCQEIYTPKYGSIDIDGAYFGPGFPFALMQAFPELMLDDGPEQFIPQLYGFKIFGMRGSHYEYKYDNDGNFLNQKEVIEILNNKRTDAYDR